MSDIVFSLMKDGGPTSGVFQLEADSGPAVTLPEEGEIDATVIIEPGEPQQTGFLKLDEPDDRMSEGLRAAAYGFWWTVKKRGVEIFRLNQSGRYKFNVAPGDRISFALEGNRGSNRAVLSYFFAPKATNLTPGSGGTSTNTSVTVSSSISSGTRVLSANLQLGSSGSLINTRQLNYQWQYAEPGSNIWADLPWASGTEYTGEKFNTLYLSRNYLIQNFARRYRVSVSSSYYTMNAVVSQEVPGLAGPIAEIPGRPQILSVEPDNSLVELSWTPAFDGFSAITSYVVQYATYSQYLPPNWVTFATPPSSATSATVTGLTNGTSYAFRVAAVNTVGQGLYSGQSNVDFGYVVPGIIPDAPTLLTATPGTGVVSLSWEPAPTYNGNSYAIEISTNGTQWSRISSGNTTDWPLGATYATLRNLTGGTEYSFRILAYGTSSKPSPPSNVMTATPTSSVPNPPTNLRVYSYYSDRSVPSDWLAEENLGLSWDDDPNFPGTPKTGQSAQYSLDGGSTWMPITSNVSNAGWAVEIVDFPTMMPRNTEFLFRAATINALGQSEWSEPKLGTTSAGEVPSMTVSRGQSSATLSWTAPSGGNAQIVDYAVSVRQGNNLNGDLYSVETGQRINGSANPSSVNLTKLTANSAVINNLTPGKLYLFTVRAINTGQTNNSSWPTGQPPGIGKPKVVRFYLPSNGALREKTASVSITPYASTPPSAPVNAPTSLAAVPGVVYTMGANEDANSVSLSWTAPTNNGGLEIIGYDIQYSGDNGSTWINSNQYVDPRNTGDFAPGYYDSQDWQVRPLNPPATTTAKVRGLTLLQPYVFRVAAINEIGTGPYGPASSSVRPTKVPLGPENFAATAGNGSVSLSWSARTVDSERLPVTGYNVRYRTEGYWSNVINNSGIYVPPGPWITANGSSPISSTSTIVTGLTNNRPYSFIVYAVNAGGQGGASTMLTRTPNP